MSWNPLHQINKIRDFGILAPVSKSNGDFTLIFSAVRFYPRLLKMKAPFTPVFNPVSWMSTKKMESNWKTI
jgi:hypothetical protein